VGNRDRITGVATLRRVSDARNADGGHGLYRYQWRLRGGWNVERTSGYGVLKSSLEPREDIEYGVCTLLYYLETAEIAGRAKLGKWHIRKGILQAEICYGIWLY
jgi:hypothetical protein